MSAFALKLIAIISMSVDHIGAVFSDSTPMYFRAIGRIAFPIYVFLVSEGCLHTKNIKKYMLRLALFALISEIPFDLAFSKGPELDFFMFTNVFYTLFLGVACVYIYETLADKLASRLKWISVLAVLPLMLVAEIIDTDYGMLGVSWIFALCAVRDKVTLVSENKSTFRSDGRLLTTKNSELFWENIFGREYKRVLVILTGVLVIYGLPLLDPNYLANLGFNAVLVFLCALSSVALIYSYNGKQGIKMKWFFYCFYPAHLVLLVIIRS